MKAFVFITVLYYVFPATSTGGSVQATILPETDQCSKEFLVSVEENLNGISIGTFSKSHKEIGTGQISGTPLTLNNYISKGCGYNHFRCENMLAETIMKNETCEALKTHLVFVSLEYQVLLVELTYNGSSMEFGAHYGISTSNRGCSPSTMVKVLDGFYVLCIDDEENSLALLELRLNRTSIARSYLLPKPVTKYQFANGHNITNASSFVYVPQIYMILFAVNNILYAVHPMENTIDIFAPIDASCTNVHKLVLTDNADGEQVLAIYCTGYVVYYSIDDGVVTSKQTYSSAGVPYVCPDMSLLSMTVYPKKGYISYNTVDGQKEDVTIDSFHSGVCYGAANHSFFAFIDRHDGLFILDTLTANVHPLLSISCLSDECQPLQVVENRYLVIRKNNKNNGDGTVFVIDTNRDRNTSLVIDAKHTSPDLLTLLVETDVKCMEHLNAQTSCNPSGVPNYKSNDNHKRVYVFVLASAVIMLVIALAVIIIFTIRNQWNKSRNNGLPIEETAGEEPLLLPVQAQDT